MSQVRSSSRAREAIASLALAAILLLVEAAPAVANADRDGRPDAPGGRAMPQAPPARYDPLSPVPPSARPWLVYAHEHGRPYPPALLEDLSRRGWGDTVEVLVQFRDGTDAEDLGLLGSLGMEALHRYKGVDAVHARGAVGAVWSLVDSGRPWYVEPVLPLVIDMDLSTAVINATRVWATRVLQTASASGRPIDGTGVTVAVVDTGIDAGHPDLDYGQKVLFNLRSDTGQAPYYEIENSDLGYGHGTHVAGTVAGNGDVSAGARRGVAPGANLIGITIDTQNSAGYVGALDWVWQSSRPYHNPYDIRVVTNSWHTTVEEYDPQQAISVLINALAHENDVTSTWSAGNDGRNDPEGKELTTSGQGNTPVGIMVAAYTHDGTGVADFSSRGKRGLAQTYPDVGAPGVDIWSCSARRTVISGGSYVGGNDNPYYLAISGTSMSTPHVAGLVAMLWQAAPSMRLSWQHEDHSGDPGDWYERDDTRIHEAEWILQATARYLDGRGLGSNGIPERDEQLDGRGEDGAPIDYVQGHGIVDAERAVAVALALQKLRTEHPTWNVTVADALASYEASMEDREVEAPTDTLSASWAGEYSRYNDQLGKPYAIQNQSHLLYVPEGVEEVRVQLAYAGANLEELVAGTVTWTVDFGFDGSIDAQGSLAPVTTGVRTGTVSASGQTGKWWAFSVLGQGFRVQRPVQDRNYVEVRIEYTTGVLARLSAGAGQLVVPVPEGTFMAIAQPWVFGPPTADHGDGTVVLRTLSYNTSLVDMRIAPPTAPRREREGGAVWGWLALALLAGASVLVVLRARAHRMPVGAYARALPGRVAGTAGGVVARVRRRRRAV